MRGTGMRRLDTIAQQIIARPPAAATMATAADADARSSATPPYKFVLMGERGDASGSRTDEIARQLRELHGLTVLNVVVAPAIAGTIVKRN